MKYLIISIAVTVSLLPINMAYARNTECSEGKAPGKEYHGSNVALPSPKDRQILGVWRHTDLTGLNVSLEVVKGNVYYVTRDRYCGSGKWGELMRKKGARYYRLDSRTGDFFEILANGKLGRFDNQGLIGDLPVSDRLHPL
jgi:hypothetical protein